MGLTCSLAGHDFADTVTERERTDHGSETVRTIRATETCRRCGHTRVIAENTEITTNPDSADSTDRIGEETPTDRADRAPANGPSNTRPGSPAGEPQPEHADDPIGPTAAIVQGRSLEASELYCPNCPFAESALGSALRAGDSCPECIEGYLARRTRKE